MKIKSSLTVLFISFSLITFSQLTKGNFSVMFGGEAPFEAQKMFEKYPIVKASQVGNNKAQVSLGLNYGITNNISLGFYSNFINSYESSFKRTSYGPTLRVFIPISKLDSLSPIYSYKDSLAETKKQAKYKTNFLYVETGVMFGDISRDSLTFKNQSYNLSLGTVLRLPVNNKFFGRLGIDISVGAKYYINDLNTFTFGPIIKGGLVFYLDKKYNLMSESLKSVKLKKEEAEKRRRAGY